MDRRLLLASGLAFLGASAANAQPGAEPEYGSPRGDNGMPQPGLQPAQPTYPTGQKPDG
jgi:hypothetical protein